MRDWSTEQELIFQENRADQNSLLTSSSFGQYTLPDQSTLTVYQNNNTVNPNTFIQVKNDQGVVIAIGYFKHNPPEAINQIVVKVIQPMGNDELLFAMLSTQTLYDYRQSVLRAQRLDSWW